MANAISASEGYYQDRLAHSPSFLSRLQVQMITVALNVKAESLSTPKHDIRSAYASAVLQNPEGNVSRAAVTLSTTANLIGTVTVTDGVAITTATDPAIFNQVTSSWTILAGGDTGV